MPYFSIVIPLYNKENHIIDTVNSVLSQTFTDYELLIINDGSTDKSLEMVSSLNDSRIQLFSQENSGLSATRNFGIKESVADHIAFIDADDLWLPNHLEQLHGIIESFPNKGIYCTGYAQQRSSKVLHRARFNKLPDDFVGVVPDFFENSLQNCVAWISAISIPKKIFEELGVFDVDIYSEQDTDLYIRIALKHGVALDNSSASAIYNKTLSNNNMSDDFKNRDLPKLFHSYKIEEAENPSLKKFVDINRFAYALLFKMANRPGSSNILKKDISRDSLNGSQSLLLGLPRTILKPLFFLKNRLFMNAAFLFKRG